MTTMPRWNREQDVRSSDGCARDMVWIPGGTFRMDGTRRTTRPTRQRRAALPKIRGGGREDRSYDSRLPNIKIPRRVLKAARSSAHRTTTGRYRPAARHAEPVDTSTGYVGFAA